jgi:hypothetical protein
VADVVFNAAKGKLAYYADLPGTDDALIAVLLQSGGQADNVLIDNDTLADVLANNAEADFTNYSRQVLTGVSVTVDDLTNTVSLDADDITWATAGGATNNTLAKLLICYDPDTTGGDDSEIIPLTAHDVGLTTDGATIVITLDPAGFAQIS